MCMVTLHISDDAKVLACGRILSNETLLLKERRSMNGLPTSALQSLLQASEKAQARLEKQGTIQAKKRIQASQKARESLKKTVERG